MQPYKYSRRAFLAQLGLVTAGGVLAACAQPAAGPAATTGQQAAPAAGAGAAEVAPGVPRTETLILENPTGRVVPADDFNRWRPGIQSASTGLQQLALDALWYIDPDAGIDGVWDNSLAAEKPIYNEDFTQMTVKLRQGIYWSDGVEFTADDLIYTVDIQKNTPGLAYSGQFAKYVDHMEKPDDYTVVFHLTEPNSRFHGLFTVRWSACFMMPKHIFEQQEDVVAFTFNPPVSLGPYVLKDFDPNGNWYLWERREDWERTTLARFGMPAPKYAMYVAPGPSDKKVMGQTSHDLDVIHDIAPEGMITLARTNPTSRGWFKSFPWAHPDPTLPSVIYNNEKPGLNNRDVRWALTLAIDIVRVAMASYRGAATISAIHVPPTGLYPQYYFDPLQDWLHDFTLDIGGEAYKPYDPDASLRIADEARKALGDMVPTDVNEIRKAIGYGWWKYDLDAAERLMLQAGCSRDANGMWLLPNGEPFKIALLAEGETRPVMNRGAAMIVENWKEFGIDASLDVRDNASRARLALLGEFDAEFGWTIETWGGHPDLFFFLESWHSDFYRPTGENAVGRNRMRWKHPELDRIIEAIQRLDFDDPKGIELGQEFIKLAAHEMPITPIMSYNVFSVCDEYYWEGFPTAENPYTNPVANWANTKYMFVKIRPKQQA
ncbi:ABC transporter substrate-binding protein [Litorilinea aerophila]|uniref:ABC transporter substrate-binding protein n=1 Tax=Litorilinea aerophila TaxID=1204385 RepID=A0A540VCA2_9CHLR|nr:ABC transporter substrate-binding protein [Litorilinea aerophila]MCC9077775.1 ABC transporter substrate-binding protein [Litorilinea aerophila]OUC07685.1 peptide ABC transporter [Litorilinea aerophila]GIV79034.1 MAG: peptide ABC transporter substrate-binding protein [Litorilinea sp.]